MGIAFLATSVVVISVNETAPEILSCCLDMTFIMQIDDWAFQALTFTFVNEYDLNFEFDFVAHLEPINDIDSIQHSVRLNLNDDINDNADMDTDSSSGDTDDASPQLLTKTTKTPLEQAKQQVIDSEKEYRYYIFWWSRSFAIMALYAGMIVFVYVDIYFFTLKTLLTRG